MTTPGRIDRATRLIKAAPNAVYRALMDPTALMAWLPPKGMTGRIDLFEPEVGGRYRFRLHFDEPGQGRGKTTPDADVVEGRFSELIPDERVVQKADFQSDDPSFAGTMTVAWEIEAREEGSRVNVICTDVPSGISAEDHQAGLDSSLENLSTFLEEAGRTASTGSPG